MCAGGVAAPPKLFNKAERQLGPTGFDPGNKKAPSRLLQFQQRPPSSQPFPQGEGESFAVFLKIHTAGFAGRSTAKLKRALAFPSPRGRVALLGIAQRQICIKYDKKSRNRQRAKPLAENVKTIGNWIHINRRKKNITPSRLAIQMGIATALIYSWESGIGQPNSHQLDVLAKFFGCNANSDPTRTIGKGS